MKKEIDVGRIYIMMSNYWKVKESLKLLAFFRLQ